MGEAARAVTAEKSTVIPRVGRYVGTDGTYAMVDLGDQRVPVMWGTPWVPQVNESVWVDSIDGRLRLSGPTTPKPGVGVVETVAGAMAVVQTAFGKFTLPVAPSTPAPSSGDTVGILWSEQPWCTLLVDLPEPAEPPPPPPDSSGTVQTAVFKAIDAGSTDRNRARWWQAQPWSSESTYGAWFYGNQIKDTIPPGAQLQYVDGVPQLQFFVAWDRRRYGGSRFALHSDAFKGGVPAMSGTTVWNPGDGFQTPPNAQEWFDALKAGGSRFGVGLNQGGYEQFKSLAQDGMSGALKISWR